MRNKKLLKYNTISNIIFGIKTSLFASKFFFLCKCFILLSTTLMPLSTIWLWKEMINGITSKSDNNYILMILSIYIIIQMITYLLARFDIYVNQRYSDELTFYIEEIMIDKTSRMDLSFFDSAKMGDKVRHVRNNFAIIKDTTWLVFNIISAIINIIATFFIVLSFNLWIGVLTLVLLVPFMVYNRKYTEKRFLMEKEQIRDNRMMDFYGSTFLNNDIQLEIKLNNIGDYFISKHKEIWSKLYKVNTGEDIKHSIINTLILQISMLSEIATLVISTIYVLRKTIGIGELQYNITIVSRLRGQTKALMADINRFMVNNVCLNELRDFIEIQPEIEISGNLIPESNPQICFKNVSFRYPNTDNFAIKNCSFTISPYEKIGLIGLNGSGKTTIIKLLFRFYDPEEGLILIDDIDIKQYNVYELRKIFGVLFQDYITYCLPLREIIALPDFNQRYNNERLKNACRTSGAYDIFKNWENGFDSIIGRYYSDNGKDLSGGQWQLVGLARAYFKNSQFMILDEPSASLDPISEDKIFEQLYKLSERKSSITISHRLSNTIRADKILVIDAGRIIEQGSHHELLALNGKYAHLFNLQAKKYI